MVELIAEIMSVIYIMKRKRRKMDIGKLYQVKLLRTDKNGGFFKTLQEALLKQKEYETKDWYATIIRVDPEHRNPLYGQDGWPIAL